MRRPLLHSTGGLAVAAGVLGRSQGKGRASWRRAAQRAAVCPLNHRLHVVALGSRLLRRLLFRVGVDLCKPATAAHAGAA